MRVRVLGCVGLGGVDVGKERGNNGKEGRGRRSGS